MNKQLLRDLCALDAVSGRETAVREFILDHLARHAAPHETQVDGMGNVIVHLFGREAAARRVQIDAHMDEVGFIVTHIGEDGLLRFATVGGIDAQALFGHRVRIGAVAGVIGGKAIHQCKDGEEKSIPAVDAMTIDIGAADPDEAKELVRVGDTGTFAQELEDWQGDFFCGKAVDDRVGCALLLTLAEAVPPRDIWLSFCVQEEVGLRGAKAAAERVRPDIAIAVDATAAGDTVGSTAESAVSHIGAGGVVSYADRSTLYDHELYTRIRKLADDHGIAAQTKTRLAGGNNAAAIQRSGEGVRVASVSLPCRYIHSSSCVGSWADVAAMESLLRVLIEELTA